MRFKWWSLAAAVGLALSLAGAAQAQTKSLVWKQYDVDITVQTNGDLRVVETQTIEFLSGTFRFGFASIPTARTEGIGDITVSEGAQAYQQAGSQAPYTFSLSESSGGVEVNWYFPPTGPGIHTYTLAYTVRGALALYPDTGDELKWTAITHDRSFPVQNGRVRVHLPEGAPPFEGRIAAQSPARVEYLVSPDLRTVTFTLHEPLDAGESMSVAVAFQHGAINAAPPAWQVEQDRRAEFETRWKPLINGALVGLGLLMLVGAPVLLYLLWYVRGRDPDVGLVPEYVAEPPADLPPGLAGTLLDEQADMQDVVATMVDLARRGVLAIEERQSKSPFGTLNRGFVIRKAAEPDGLRPFEKMLYAGLLGAREARDMQDMSGHFAATLYRVQQQLYQASVKEGFFKSSPEAVRMAYVVGGALVLGMAAVGGVVAAAAFSAVADTVICLFVPLALLGIGLMAIAHRMPAKTRKGAEQAARWRAFKTYLANIEKYADLKAAADLFDRYLPYAIAFGLERRWVTTFARVPATPMPGWYIPVPMGMPRPAMGRGVMAAPAPAAAPSAPSLQAASDGLAGGLQSMSDGLVNWLNTASRTFSAPPPQATYGTTIARGGSRGFTGGGRSFSGGFRSGGFSGGGGRGFG